MSVLSQSCKFKTSLVLKKLTILIFITILFSTSNVFAQDDMWRRIKDLGNVSNLEREGAISFTIEDKLYVGLGVSGTSYYKDIWEYDATNDIWIEHQEFPGQGTAFAFCFVVNNTAIVGTGQTSGGATNKVYEFNPGATTEWVEKTDFPDARLKALGVSNSAKNRGYVIGGYDGVAKKDLIQFNPNGNSGAGEWFTKKVFPGNARIDAIAFSLNNYLYYGYGNVSGTLSDTLWKVFIGDDNLNIWNQEMDGSPSARSGAITAVANGIAYMGFGDDGTLLQDWYKFDPVGLTWTAQKSLDKDPYGTGRQFVTASSIGEEVYLGTGSGPTTEYSDFYVWLECAPPFITDQPNNLDVCEGVDVVFNISVDVGDPGTETYQWYKGSNPISGATLDSLYLTAVTIADIDNYSCHITSNCGETTISNSASLIITPLPVGAPSGLSASPSELCPDNVFDITLSANDNGVNTDTLRWYTVSCGGALVGEGINILVPVPDPLPDSITYYAVWENDCGISDCDSITVYVKQEPEAPTALSASMDTICHDHTGDLFLYAEGGTGDELNWYIGNICTNPSATFLATGDTINLGDLGMLPASTTTYSARWETTCGGNDFNSSCLTIDIVVNGEIDILYPPNPVTECVGEDSVYFRVVPDLGNSVTDIHFQWYKNGNAISGANNDTLWFYNPLTLANEGYYKCKVFNTCDTIMSDSAAMVLNTGAQFVQQPVAPVSLCEGGADTLFSQATGSLTVQYQWYFNDVATGVTDSFFIINPATYANSGEYFVYAVNGCGADTSDVINVVVDTLPGMVTQPQDTTVCLNGTATFEVSASGSIPLFYQWYRINGAAGEVLTGQANSLFEILNVQVTDTVYDYYCIVENACGTVSSDTVNLALYSSIAEMAVDSIVSDTNYVCLDYPNQITLTVFGGAGDSIQWRTGSCSGDIFATTAESFVSIDIPTDTTTYFANWISPCGTGACDSITIFVKGDPLPPTSVISNVDTICHDYTDELYLVADGGMGDSLVWYLGDICSNPSAVQIATGDTLNLLDLGMIPTETTIYSARWETYCTNDLNSTCVVDTIFVNGSFTISAQPVPILGECLGVDSLFFNIQVNTTELISDFSYQWYHNGTAISNTNNDTLWFFNPITLADTGYYKCEVVSPCDTVVSDSVRLTLNTPAQIILEPVAPTQLCEGEGDTLYVQFQGSLTVFGEWYFNNVATGISDTAFIINPATFDNSGAYFYYAENGCGSDTSDVVTILVDTLPGITQQPMDTSVCINGNATFSVMADGTAPLTYQWYRYNATTDEPLGGQTTPTYQILNVQPTDTIYDFYCIVENSCGFISSDTVSLDLYGNVASMAIDSIVADTNFICLDYPNQITLTVYGGGGDSIQWKTGSCNGDVFQTTTETSITIDVPSDTTTYYANWISPCGTGACDSITIYIKGDPNPPTNIISSSDTICTNYSDELFLIAEGGTGDSLVWYLGDVCTNPNAVQLATGDTLDLQAIGMIPTTTSVYSARWETNCTDDLLSSCVIDTIFVNGQFAITDQPDYINGACLGDTNWFFNVVIDSSNLLTGFEYLWYHNGNPVANSDNDTLYFTNPITLADTGYYYCEVFSPCDTLASDSARFVINTPAQIILDPIAPMQLCEGSGDTLFVQFEGTETVFGEWYFNNAGTGISDTALIINPATYDNSGDYYYFVENACGADTSNMITIVVDTLPGVIQQPQDQIVCLNGTATFSFIADGTAPLSYQWYKIDGAPGTEIAGQTNSTFQLVNVQEIDSTFQYYCTIENDCGITSTDTVSLFIHNQAAIADSMTISPSYICNDHPNELEVIVYGGINGDFLGLYTGDCGLDLVTTSEDTVFYITPPITTTTYYIRWETECGTSACKTFTVDVTGPPVMMESLEFEANNICRDDYINDSLLLTAVGGSGDSIYWINDLSCNAEPFRVTAEPFIYLSYDEIPMNTSVYRAKWVNVCGESSCASTQLNINSQVAINFVPDTIRACEGDQAVLFIDASGQEPLNYQWYDENGAINGETNATLVINPVDENSIGDYYCEVSNACNTVLSDTITLVMKLNPYFGETNAFADTLVCEGSELNLVINPQGYEPIYTIWYKDGDQLTGFGQVYSYNIDPVQGGDAGEYWVSLTNECENNVLSDPITVSVLEVNQITQDPYPSYVEKCLLDEVEFNIDVDLNDQSIIEWFKTDNPGVVLATGPTLILTNLTYDDEGDYYCVISSDYCGTSIESEIAHLEMLTAPNNVSPLTDQTRCEGTTNFQFDVTADGEQLEYQWYYSQNLNGPFVILPGETFSSLIFSYIERDDEGFYRCEVYNACESLYTNKAKLTVDWLPDPVQSVFAQPDSVCLADEFEVTLTATGGGDMFGESTLYWFEGSCSSTPAGTIGSGYTINIQRPTQTTVYYAQWINSCTQEVGATQCLNDTVYFVPDPQPSSTITADPSSVICENLGEPITLTASDDAIGELAEWYIVENGELIPTEFTGRQIEVQQPMDTIVYGVIWSNLCGESEITTIQIDVVPLPVISLKTLDSICPSPTIDNPYLIDEEIAQVEYSSSVSWTSSSAGGYFNDSSLIAPIYYDNSINPYDTTIVYLTLRAEGLTPCSYVEEVVTLVYKPRSMPTYSPDITAICRDSIILIEAFNNIEYRWISQSDTNTQYTGSEVYFSPVETTDYWLVGENEFKCVDTTTLSIDVYPTPLVELGDSVFLYSCEPVQLDAGGGDGSEYYIWSNGFRTRSITVYESGNYSVIVGNPGCSVGDTAYISLCNGRIFMPTAFTPNLDGLNEVFKPITSDPSLEFQMMIYDRWGQLMFETNDLHEGWDGNFNGEPCPAGNYVWRINYQGQGESAPGKKGSEVGTVMLVR